LQYLLAMSGMRPSATIVSARRQRSWASAGKSSKSRRAALIQLIGRVLRAIETMLSCMTTERQVVGA
jgi:hypothetical protein